MESANEKVSAVVAGATAPRLAAKLTQLGLSSFACSAERAPDEVARLRPGVLVIERGGAREAGLAACRAVRANPMLGGVAVLIVDARENLQDLLAALDAGADDVVSPLSPPAEIAARAVSASRIRAIRNAREGGRHREALASLAAAVGEEINSPLTALFGHLELARQWIERGDNARALHHLRESGEAGKRVGRAAARLAGAAEAAARREPAAPEPVSG